MRSKSLISLLIILLLSFTQTKTFAQNHPLDRIDMLFLNEVKNSSDWIEVVLELKDLPGVEFWHKTHPSTAMTALPMQRTQLLDDTLSYQKTLRNKQESFLSWADKNNIKILPKHHMVLNLNAITAEVRASDLASLSSCPHLHKIHDARQKFELMRQLGAKSSGVDKAWSGFPEVKIPSLSGKKILIGVMDTGLDTLHPEFTKAGKVRGGYNFAENNKDLSDAGSHGTHVAGIAAGQGSREEQQGKGMAYDADIMVYKIFSKSNMSSADVLGAMEQATKDRCDVLNLSFGGSSNESSTADTAYHRSMRNADQAGIFVVAGAGNSGARRKEVPWPIIIPSIIDTTFSVAGSDDRKEGPVLSVQIDSSEKRIFQAIHTPNSPRLQNEMLQKGIIFSGYGMKNELSTLDLKNKVALIQRGPATNSISYRDKLENAFQAGAIGVIFFNNSPHQNVTPYILKPGEDSTHVKHLPPSISLSLEDGEFLKKLLANRAKVSIEYQQVSTIASFSSMGLSGDSSFKPEITAPATQIVSTIPGGSYSPMDGTSMATPMISGLSALLKEARPSWTHQQIKSAFMNTAEIMLNPINQLPITFTLQGAGTARLDKAINTPAFLEPRALVLSETAETVTQTFKITNASKNKQDFALSAEFYHLNHEFLPVKVSFDKKEISLDAGKENTFKATITMDRKAFLQNRYEGIIKVGKELHIPIICYRDPAYQTEEVLSNIRISQDHLDLTKASNSEMLPLQISFSMNAGNLSTIITKEYTFHIGDNYGTVYFYIADEDGEEWARLGSMSNIMVGEYTFLWNGRDENNLLFLPKGKFFLHFTMNMREYKDQQWTTKPYGPFRKAFFVEDSDLPQPIPARFSVYKLFSEKQKVKLGVRLEDFSTILETDGALTQIEFKVRYSAEQLLYKKYQLTGFLKPYQDQVKVKVDDDGNEGILYVKMICNNLSMDHLDELAFLDFEFSILEKGRISFMPHAFSIRTTSNNVYRVKAPQVQSRITDRSFLLCDLNKDNVVDRLDFGLFMNSYGSKQGDSSFDGRCDFNQDMRIDILDLLTMAKEMGSFI